MFHPLQNHPSRRVFFINRIGGERSYSLGLALVSLRVDMDGNANFALNTALSKQGLT